MRWLAAVGALALVACGRQPTPQEQKAKDAQDVAMVKAANRTAIELIEPQPILYPDIQKNHLAGTGCAFVASGGGLAAVMITRPDRAYMKLGGEVTRFSADMGSAQLPGGAQAKYSGKDISLELAIDTARGSTKGSSSATYSGRLTARDAAGNAVYDQPGSVQCG
jgi:hypothetical protein